MRSTRANNGSANQYRNNNLSHSVGLGIENDTQFHVSRNDFRGTGGVFLSGQVGATISPVPGPGQLDIDVSQAAGGLILNGVRDSHIAGLNLSYAGGTSTGNGLQVQNSSNNVIDGITATNRGNAIYLTGSYANNVIQNSDLSGAGGYTIYARYNGNANQYLNNNLSNAASVGLLIENDTQFQVSGNDLTGTGGVFLSGQVGATISPEPGPGQLDIDVSQSRAGLVLNGVRDSHIAGLNLSYEGATPTGIGLAIQNSSNNVLDEITVEDR